MYDERLKLVTESFRDVLSGYLAFDMGGFRIITARDDTGHRRIEDILSIADLGAGAWCELYNTISQATEVNHLHRLVEEKGARVRQKSELIMQWCSRNSHRPLKYMSIVLSPGDHDSPVYGQFTYPRLP